MGADPNPKRTDSSHKVSEVGQALTSQLDALASLNITQGVLQDQIFPIYCNIPQVGIFNIRGVRGLVLGGED